jgi:hypothetical protein
MTALVPAADSAASQQAVVDAALLLLGQMGLSPEDLLLVPRERPVLPTFAEYVPVVSGETAVVLRTDQGRPMIVCAPDDRAPPRGRACGCQGNPGQDCLAGREAP